MTLYNIPANIFKQSCFCPPSLRVCTLIFQYINFERFWADNVNFSFNFRINFVVIRCIRETNYQIKIGAEVFINLITMELASTLYPMPLRGVLCCYTGNTFLIYCTSVCSFDC